MKMLVFDFRDSEKEFFEKNKFPDFDITFIKEPLNEMSQLSQEQFDETDVISVFISSFATPKRPTAFAAFNQSGKKVLIAMSRLVGLKCGASFFQQPFRFFKCIVINNS